MNNSVYYKATDEDGNIILRHAYNKKYQKGWKQNLDDNAARKKNDWKRELELNAKINADKKAEAEKKKQNQQAREDYVRVNRRKKVQKVVGEVKKFTKPGTPYKGPTSAFQAQQIQKDKKRQKLAYKGPTSAYQAQQIQKDKERQKLAKELKNRKIAEQNRRAREKAANINRRRKAGKAYLNNLTK